MASKPRRVGLSRSLAIRDDVRRYGATVPRVDAQASRGASRIWRRATAENQHPTRHRTLTLCSQAVPPAAFKMDGKGPTEPQGFISIVKIKVPKMCYDVADRAMQMHDGMCVTEDSSIRHTWMMSRACQIADSPYEMHISLLARRSIRYNY